MSNPVDIVRIAKYPGSVCSRNYASLSFYGSKKQVMSNPKVSFFTAAVDSVAEPPEEDVTVMFCTQCGTRNPDDANFCQKCGRTTGRAARPLDDSEFSMLQQPEDRVGDLLAIAFRRREQGDIDGAIRACAGALQVLPESTSAHSLMGMLFEAQGEREKAITEFERVLALNPGSIADREKLEQLRDSTTAITPRKITSSQSKRTSLFDSPAGAAAAAVIVFMLVLSVGVWAVMTRDKGRAVQKLHGSGPMPNPVAASTQVNQQPQMNQAQAFNNGWPVGVNPNAPQANQNAPAAATQNPPAPQNQAVTQNPPAPAPPVGGSNSTERLPTFRRGIGPASINSPPAKILSTPVLTAFPRENDNTVLLPERNGLSTSELGPGPNVGRVGSESPRSNPGSKIEIVVSQDNGNSTAPGTPATSSQQPSNSSMDSRSRRAMAHQAQLGGDYRRAVREYLKALDGAGDDTASIHQQIGICYQRLDDKESAKTHYNDAIAAYKQLIAAGKNVESAQSGIRACERSLRAL